jgi:hypothetical protein
MMKKAGNEGMMTQFDCGRGALTPHGAPRLLLLLAALAFCGSVHAQTTGIYVNSSNNVGIGTTSPDLKLQANVGTAATYGLGVYNTNDNLKLLFGTTTGSYLNIQGRTINTNVPYNMALQAEGGNVGIGTTNPLAAKLAVMGNISFDASGASQERIIGLQRPDGLGWNNTPHLSFKTDSNSNGYLTFSTINSGVAGHPDMVTFNYNGNVGIGTTSPLTLLHVYNGASGATAYGNSYLTVENSGRAIIQLLTPKSNDSYLMFGNPDGANRGYVGYQGSGMTPGDQMVFYSHGTYALLGGNVGIGTTSPGYMLDVAGQVHATSFVSSTQTYADFVFKPGYKLAPLSDVEASIQKDGHLPGIPSEAEAKAHGIDLASMQVKLLQKIEELTLHQIDQEKRLNEQANDIKQLREENAELREELTK